MSSLAIYGVLAYLVILFMLSAFFVKKALNSYKEYSFCGRSLSFVFILFTYLATWIGGGTIVGLVGRTYDNGAGQYWVIAISCVVGMFFVLLFLSRIRSLHVSSVAEFLALRFPERGGIIRIPAAAGVLIRNVTMTGMQFSALSYMITYVFGINNNLALLLIFLIITSYTVLSGLWGVVMTDLFQGLLQTSGIFLLVMLTLRLSGGMDEVVRFYSSTGDESFLNFFQFQDSGVDLLKYILAFGLFFLMNDQGDWERIYSSKTDKTAFWGYLIPLVITMMLLVFTAYLGVFQRVLSSGDVDSEYVLYQFIFESIGVKSAVFILIGLIAAIMSSADSFMLASGVVFSNDIVKRFINRDAGDQELIFWTRAFVVVTGAMGFAFAMNTDDIISLWLTGIGMATILVIPAYLLAWFSTRANGTGCLFGMASGAVICLLIGFGAMSPGVNQILLGMAVNLFVSYTVSLFTRKPDPGTVAETFYWSERFRIVKNIPQ